MQSAIHDLSWYAVTDRNNDNARLLEKYMKDAGGLAGLTSEWWHFQDDQLREELDLSGYLDKGVSAAGWKKDDKGWQYRKPDGTLYRSGTIEIDGQRYKMGSDGYVVEWPFAPPGTIALPPAYNIAGQEGDHSAEAESADCALFAAGWYKFRASVGEW